MMHSLILLVLLAGATDEPIPMIPPPLPPPTALSSPSDFHEVAPGILEYHGVRLDRTKRQVSFAATIEQTQGLVEYLLVNIKGKTYESILSTKVDPHDIHLALLLLGLKQDEAAAPKETPPPSAIDSAYLHAEPKTTGAPIRLFLRWTQNGKPKEAPAENWILNLQTKKPMTVGLWTYNGSLVQDGVFLADEEGSIVSVITDPTALVNNPRPGYDNDLIWQVRNDVVPPQNTSVEVTIQLPPLVHTRP